MVPETQSGRLTSAIDLTRPARRRTGRRGYRSVGASWCSGGKAQPMMPADSAIASSVAAPRFIAHGDCRT